MSVATEKTLRDLEFERLKAIVRSYASSSIGEEAVAALVPLADRDTLMSGFSEMREAISFLAKHGRFSLGGVRDLMPYLERGKQGSFLDGEDLLVVLETIDATKELRMRFLAEEEYGHLRAHAERLTGGGESIGRMIRRIIDERGAVRDDASPLLAQLTSKRRIVEARLETKLKTLIDRNPELISEAVITRRRGRLVVPVRSGAVGSMDFVIHDRSATGQTLYAEPTALVSENNALAEITEEIRDETRRILREATEALVASEAAFLRDRAVLAHFDSLFARAAFAEAYRCSLPQLGRRVRLRDARHPLLVRDRAVPISLSMGEGARMTVITGPNTGGKTVTLKTLGLLTLMIQSVIPVPASPDSEFRVFSKIRTDIGDEQSIEQSLSTFSAHMSNIVTVLSDADSDCLVLLDELGAGTDPQEGAALGIAVLEALLDTGALVAVSTHLTPLKFFAIRHPQIKTASMEFDVASLSPTYRVIEGVPGRSNAFIIAERLGLPHDLIARARGFLSQGEIRAEDIIDELNRERQALHAQREKAQQDRELARQMREQYEMKLSAFETQREQELAQNVKEFETFLRRGQQRVEQLLSQIHAGDAADGARDAVHEISDLRAEAAQRRAALAQSAPAREPLDPGALETGQLVRVRSVDTNGRIVHLDAVKGKVAVDLEGGIRVSTDVADLEPPLDARKREPRARNVQMSRPRPSQVPLQIDLRGSNVQEALRKVDQYLDQLLRADMRHASILHGKGTGVLRDAVRTYLASCSFVTAFGYAPPNRGGDGVTEFELAGGDAAR